jgi:hypothetical protein
MLMNFLVWLEDAGGIGTFVRESPSILGYPTFIVLHTLGLSIVVGTSTVIAARVLGYADSIPLQSLGLLFRVIWFGFTINTISGGGLALATASTQFTNPILLTKLALVFMAIGCLWALQVKIFRDPVIAEQGEIPSEKVKTAKLLARGMLGLWLFAMIAGRLIAYAGVIIGR